MKYVKSLALALAVPFLLATPHASLARDAKVDQQYVAFLYDTLWDLNPLAHSFAKDYFSDDENVKYAHLMCESFSQGYTLEQVAAELGKTPEVANLPPSSQEAVGNYVGVVAYASTIYYCPEYRTKVETARQ